MAYSITNKPTLKANKTPVQSNVKIQSASEAIKTSSSNAAYGMADVPEEFKKKQMTQEQMQSAIQKGELMYGPIPAIPTQEAIEGIKFDYCDGLRIFIPKQEEGKPKKKYFVQIMEERFGVVFHNGILESDAYITTLQKFYTEFSLKIVAENPLPEDIKADLVNIDVDDQSRQFLLELAYVPDMTIEIMMSEYKSKHDMENPVWLEKACHIILDYVRANMYFYHRFNPEGKDVLVQLPVGTIGDSVGWFAYMERFQEKTKCNLICVMNPVISVLFEKQYPTIKFITPRHTCEYSPYAGYRIGLYFKSNTTDQPYDFRYIGNHRTASKILDVNDDDIAPRVDLSAPRQIKDPYVCIAVQASAYCKLWNNPSGWEDVIKHLKKLGYRILCIDKDTHTGQGIAVNRIPWGVEDFTGNKPLQERIDLLKDCDFFIGLSSGVSWLAWCAKCPVVMISGFTNPFNEFYTPYRVINTMFCHGCWNDERCEFDHFDYMWCPRHKGTEKAYECSRSISSRHVINTIKTIPAYQAQLEKCVRSATVNDVNKHLIAACQEGDVICAQVNNEGIDRVLALKSQSISNEAIASEIAGFTSETVEFTLSSYNKNKDSLSN